MSESHEVGTLGEEAARLLGTLVGLVREHEAGDEAGGHQAGKHETGDGEDAAGHKCAPECSLCPVCRTLHAVRALSPEVRSHLTAAGSHLLQAGLALLAHDTAAGARDGDRRDGSPVEHIDLDAEWPDAEWPDAGEPDAGEQG